MENEALFAIVVGVILTISIVTIMILIGNYKEQRQCDILEKGNTEVIIEYFYGVMKKCYVTLENGKIINADNYRAFAEQKMTEKIKGSISALGKTNRLAVDGTWYQLAANAAPFLTKYNVGDLVHITLSGKEIDNRGQKIKEARN